MTLDSAAWDVPNKFQSYFAAPGFSKCPPPKTLSKHKPGQREGEGSWGWGRFGGRQPPGKLMGFDTSRTGHARSMVGIFSGRARRILLRPPRRSNLTHTYLSGRMGERSM